MAGKLRGWILDTIWKFKVNDGTDRTVFDEAGYLYQRDTKITATGAELNMLDLSAVGAALKVKTIDIDTPADGAETGTGFVLPDAAVVLDVFVHVLTAEATGATKTLDVGTDSVDSGDADGYIDGVNVASTGIKRPSLAFGAVTRGVLLKENTGDGTAPVPIPDVTMGGKEITYTAGSADFVELVAKLYIVYLELDYTAPA